MAKTKIVYALWVHIELQKRGIGYLTEMRNPSNPNLNCWVYESNDEFERVFGEIICLKNLK